MGKIVTSDATITLTIKAKNLGSWGEDCKINQLLRQSNEAALNYVRNVVAGFEIESEVTDIKVSFRER